MLSPFRTKLNKVIRNGKPKLKFSVIFAIVAIISFTTAVRASWPSETYWVADPSLCPVDYRGIKGGAGTEVCGVDFTNELIYFYDTDSLSAPVGSETTWSNNSVSTSTGGYYLDCYSRDGSVGGGDPYCDDSGTWYCQRDSDCYTNNRQTTCVAGEAASSTCSDCRSGYQDCDVDPDDCEIQTNVSDCDELAGGDDAHNRVIGRLFVRLRYWLV
jgi:hypothetical protein